MSFRTFGENGLLLYGGVGESEKIGDTDFISVAIVDRFVEFAFDLGGGMVVLKSSKQVNLGNAHKYHLQHLKIIIPFTYLNCLVFMEIVELH